MDILKKLISVNTVAGTEYKNSYKIKEIFDSIDVKTSIDVLGNIISVKKSKNSKFKVLIDAHIDTIGLMVTKVSDGGFVHFTTVGGFDKRILPGCEVVIHGKESIYGVIGSKPPHLITDNSKIPYPISELFIDTGYSKNELLKKIEVGDIVTFKTEVTNLLNKQIAASGLDDKLGVYVNYQVMKNFSSDNCDLISVATISEEIGLKGAKVVNSILSDIDLAIVVDVTHGKTPDGIEERSFQLGKGPVITMGPALNRKENLAIIDYAKRENIPYNIEVEGGDTGTNAWVFHSSHLSVPTVMLSIPLKYMHTSYEVASTYDVDMLVKLMIGYLEERSKIC